MPRKKDPEITQYKLKNGQTYFRLKTYIGIDPETGKTIKVTRSKLGSRKEAEQLRNKLKSQGPAAIAHNLQNSENRKTVADVFTTWLEVQKSDVRGATISRFKDTWKNHIKPEFGDNFIDSVYPDHIQKYVNELSQKYVTYRNMINMLHRLVKYAIFRHWADHDPFDYVLIPKKSAVKKRDTSHNFYERAELLHFLDVAKRYDLMKYTYFHTVASLGTRRSEALALKWSDLNFDKQTVAIQRTVSKDENGKKTIDDVKNGLHHTVPMSNNLKQILLDYKKHCNDKGDHCEWIFHQSDGTVWWPQQIDLWIKWLYKFDKKQVDSWNKEHPNETQKKPLRHITPHGLRHTLATLLYDGNSNIKPQDVQFMLGHKTPKTAMEIYTHVTQKQKQDVSDSINNLNL